MPIEVGIDLVSARTVSDSISAYGARYLGRVYTERELADSAGSSGISPGRLAACFAAKEATLKALRPGDVAVPWRDIEVNRDNTGGTSVNLSGQAASLAAEVGLTSIKLSVAQERGLASAVVIARSRGCR